MFKIKELYIFILLNRTRYFNKLLIVIQHKYKHFSYLCLIIKLDRQIVTQKRIGILIML